VATDEVAGGIVNTLAAASCEVLNGWTMLGCEAIVKIAARSLGFITCFKKVAAAFC